MRSRNFFLGFTLAALASIIAVSVTNAVAQADSSAATVSPVFTTLVNFTGSNGDQPLAAPLIQGRDGDLYGTTTYGGGKHYGTFFQFTTAGKLQTVLTFTGASDNGGINPFVGLVLGVDGSYYGSTAFSATNGEAGTLFKIIPPRYFNTLYIFDESDGGFPYSPLLQTADGSFYGTTAAGGANSGGTIFNLTPGGTLTTLAGFNSETNGSDPSGALAQSADGTIYGAATGGDTGNIFALTSGGDLTDFINFAGSNGNHPTALTAGPDGSFYGPAEFGGLNGYGEIFNLTTSGALTALHSFDSSDGAYPFGALIFGTDGNLYGTTSYGGAKGAGTIFQMTPSGTLTTLHDFNADTDGSASFAGLVQHTNGIFYGVTSAGGTANMGTLFSLKTGLRPFIAFVLPTGKVGDSAQILGQGFAGATSVTFNGVPATSFLVGNNTFLTAVVPNGATTGRVVVTTATGPLTSNVNFTIIN